MNKFEAIFLGCKSDVSKLGKEYNVVSLLIGSEACKVFVDHFYKIETLKKVNVFYNVTIDYKQNLRVSIKNIELV